MLLKFKDYKVYLNQKLDDPQSGGRGARARLSRSIGCQTAYTSHVLKNSGHFTMEQVEAINEYLGHSDFESEYFLLLVQHARAGTKSLKARIDRQLWRLRDEQLLLKNRLNVKDSLSEKDQAQYYSSWSYGAVHALVSIPGFQSAEKIAERLDLPTKTVVRIIDFLLICGLLVQEKGAFKIGRGRIHLGTDSDLIWKHHANWRLKALQALEKNDTRSVHYSSAITVSVVDAENIRDLMVEAIKKAKALIPDSSEEKLMCLNLDFFEL